MNVLSNEDRLEFIQNCVDKVNEIGVLTDKEYCKTQLKRDEDFIEGRFLIHSMDYLIQTILYDMKRYYEFSGVTLKDNSFLEYLRQHLSNKPYPALTAVLKPVLSNAIRLIACNAYVYAVGEVRFVRYQRFFVVYGRLYMSAPSPLNCAYASLQICALLLPVNDVVWELTQTFLYGLDQHPDSENHENVVGRHLMSSYLIICLIAMCYERIYVKHDLQVDHNHGNSSIECINRESSTCTVESRGYEG